MAFRSVSTQIESTPFQWNRTFVRNVWGKTCSHHPWALDLHNCWWTHCQMICVCACKLPSAIGWLNVIDSNEIIAICEWICWLWYGCDWVQSSYSIFAFFVYDNCSIVQWFTHTKAHGTDPASEWWEEGPQQCAVQHSKPIAHTQINYSRRFLLHNEIIDFDYSHLLTNISIVTQKGKSHGNMPFWFIEQANVVSYSRWWSGQSRCTSVWVATVAYLII